jgi:hypothetical protein
MYKVKIFAKENSNQSLPRNRVPNIEFNPIPGAWENDILPTRQEKMYL